jgi:polyhydroxyalkanoate synthesis regulator phasin
MAIESITAWLNSADRNFLHGRLLYEQYGDDRLILTIIKSGSGNYHLQKLTEGLEKVNQLSNLQPKKITFEPPAPQPIAEPKKKQKSSPDLAAAPEVIQDIRNQKNERYAKARHLHQTIRSMDSKQHRLEAGLELLNLMDFVNESWFIIDEWVKKGTVLEMKKEEAIQSVADLTLPELVAASKNIPSSISHARKRYNISTDPRARTRALAKIQELQTKLEQVKRRLSELI